MRRQISKERELESILVRQREMNELIDHKAQECREMGIPTEESIHAFFDPYKHKFKKKINVWKINEIKKMDIPKNLPKPRKLN